MHIKLSLRESFLQSLIDLGIPESTIEICGEPGMKCTGCISKDYRNKGIIAGNKYGRFSTKWMDPISGQEYNSHWKARQNTPLGTKIVRFPEARNQLSVMSSAIDSYRYYPDVKN